MKFKIYLLSLAFFILGSTHMYTLNIQEIPIYHNYNHNLEEFFPTTTTRIQNLVDEAIQQAGKDLEIIFNLPKSKRTFLNTVYAFDKAQNNFYVTLVLLEAVEAVNPHEEMRGVAHDSVLKLRKFALNNFLQNKNFYTILKEYVQEIMPTEHLSQEQNYFIDNLLKSYEYNGLHLSDEALECLKTIKNKLSEHQLAFKRNIALENCTITLKKEDLQGLSSDFIGNLKQKTTDEYILPITTATYNAVMESCTVESTRKLVWYEFNKIGYPENKNELIKIIELRDEWAKLVGYSSFAELDISDQMAGTVQNVEEFIKGLIEKSTYKFNQEIDHLQNNLPEGVQLTPDKKFKPWDIQFVKSTYKKHCLTLDEEQISYYFPLDYTFQQLLAIYEQFFGITLKLHKNVRLWDENVTYVTVHKDTMLVGRIILDLFARKGKIPYACFIDIVPAIANYKTPALGLVIANFT